MTNRRQKFLLCFSVYILEGSEMISNKDEAIWVNDPPADISPVRSGNGDKLNAQVGIICMFYLLLAIAFVSWLLFDIWIGQHSLARWGRYELEPLNTPVFRLVFFTVLGGALGGVVNGIRSILDYYPHFDRTYAWKYIMAPWLGAALSLVAYAILNSGLSVFGGGNSVDGSPAQILAMFSTGFLAGYGARDVFAWLDFQVSRLFASDSTKFKDDLAATHENPKDVEPFSTNGKG
jgi:hypothetical protein